MTAINSQEDFLLALSNNPQWKEAVRAQILGEELLRLPARFDAFVERMDTFVKEMKGFVEEQKEFNAQISAFVEEQKQINAEIRGFVEEQRRINDRIDRRLTILSNDVAQAKGGHARLSTINNAPGIVLALNFEGYSGIKYVKDVTRAELAEMAHNAAGGDIPTNELRSFSRADLVIEASDENGPCYIAVEASFTATQRDASRAQRNAALLTRFTGRLAHAVVSSVRNDRDAEAEIALGNVWWHELEERDMEPE